MNASNSDAILSALAQEINKHARAERAAQVKGLMHAIKMGELLLEAKKVVPHGHFLAWLKDHTSVTPRMCQMYMRLAKNDHLRDSIESEYEMVSHLTLNEAVKLAAVTHKPQEESETEAVQAIKESWVLARAHVTELVLRLGEVRQALTNEDEFLKWLTADVHFSAAFAEKIPRLLDDGADEETWINAVLATGDFRA